MKRPLSPQVQPTLAVPSTCLELFQLPVLPCSSYENRRVWIGDQDVQYLDSSYRAHVDPCTTLDGVYQDFSSFPNMWSCSGYNDIVLQVHFFNTYFFTFF